MIEESGILWLLFGSTEGFFVNDPFPKSHLEILESSDLLDVVGELGNAEQSAVDSRVLNDLGMVLLVELLEGPEDGHLCPLQLAQLLDLVPQGLSRTFHEHPGEDARLTLAAEVSQEAMGIK